MQVQSNGNKKTPCSTTRKDAAHGDVPAKYHSQAAFCKPKRMLWSFHGMRHKGSESLVRSPWELEELC